MVGQTSNDDKEANIRLPAETSADHGSVNHASVTFGSVPKLAKKIASAVAEQASDAEVTASSFAFAAAVAAVELVAEEKVCSSCSYQTEVNWHMAVGMVLCGQMK